MIYWETSAVFTQTNFATNAAGTTLTWTGGGTTVASDVGRFINIRIGTGWNLGKYQIVGWGGARSVVLDRSAGSSKTNGTGDLQKSDILIYNHPIEGRFSQIASIYNTTVNAHPSPTTIDTNKKFNPAWVDLATDATGKLVNSVAGGFTADMVGMYLNRTAGGGTLGKYTIVTYTDPNNIVVDLSMGANLSGATGNVPYTAPPMGNLYITAAATGLAEFVSYSSFQDNGAGLVQYTVAAPFQTFASGDTVQISDVIFKEPSAVNYWSSKHHIRITVNTGVAPVPTTDCVFTQKGGETFHLKDNKIFWPETRTASPGLIAILNTGELDETGEFAQSANHATLIFSPLSNGTCGVIFYTSLSTLVVRWNIYNAVVKSSTANKYKEGYVNEAGYAYNSWMYMRYSTLQHHLYMTSGNWDFYRFNLFNSGLFAPATSWGGSATMEDGFYNHLCGTMGDGTYGTSNPLFMFRGVNVPLLGATPTYRVYMSNMTTGDGMKYIHTNCWPSVTQDEVHGYGSSGKNLFELVCYERRIRVIDENKNPISGAFVRFTSADGAIFNKTYTTNTEGYVNDGDYMWTSWTFGNNAAVYFATPEKRIRVVLQPYPTAPSKSTITCTPYKAVVTMTGYEDYLGYHDVDGTISRHEQLITIQMIKRRRPR